MNVLLTCIGRRGYLIDFFKAALKGEGKVIVCDSRMDSPSLKQADMACQVPPLHDPSYPEALKQICIEQRITVLIPSFEPELLILSRELGAFCEIGTTVLVSKPSIVQTCYDKLAAGEFLSRCGILALESYSTLRQAREALACGKLAFPLMLKPRFGVSSQGCEIVNDYAELALAYRLLQRRLTRDCSSVSTGGILIQNCLEGQEYGLDVVNDLEGRYVTTFVRCKHRMRAGMTDRATTLIEPRFEELGRKLGEGLGHVGILDCDVFLSRGELWVLDLNPRIGGGYPFSHAAGADFPSALIAWLKGGVPRAEWLRPRPDVTAARKDVIEVVDPVCK
jgi:carbamoyl-phosphate synthase large subunit